MTDFLADTRSWLIVGQDALAHVPWHAACSPTGRFLIEDKDIGYVPSLEALTTSAGTGSREILILGWQEELGGRPEAAQLVHLLNDSRLTPVLPADHQEGVARLLTKNRWKAIHIIAHGHSKNFPRALESSMEFGPATVTAQDILDSGASADVVFINACHLAREDGFAGDLYGFPFAFLERYSKRVHLLDRYEYLLISG